MSHENTKGKWILEVNRLWRYSLLLKIDRQRIHTVPLPGLGGTVVEDMPQVAAAVRTKDLGTYHTMTGIPHILDLSVYCPVEGGPSTTAVELGSTTEEWLITSPTCIGTLVVMYIVCSTERSFSTLTP